METNSSNAGELTLFGHLDELRRRIIYCIGYLAGGTLAGFFFAKPLIEFLKLPARGAIDTFIVTRPAEIMTVYFKVAVYAGAVIACPAVFFHAWQFLKPAVPDDFRKTLPRWVLAAALLFAGGTAFAFEVLLPTGISFLMKLTRETAVPWITLNHYISFVLSLLLIGGTVFEIPVVAAGLARAGIITPALMRRKRKEVIFGLFVLAAIITPTTDIFNMLLFALPMVGLYEASIIVAGLVAVPAAREPYGEVYRNEVP